MDAFFASCEERHNPALRGLPFAVGGLSMISTASYAARRFGVRSAMPGFIGKALCPGLIFVDHNFERYRVASDQTREIFKQFDPSFEAGSLDEAYLDITDYSRSNGLSSAQVAEELRRRVREDLGLTCSCGVGPNMMIAKIAADKQKPDGQFIVGSSQEEVLSFVRSLPVRKIPGIGRMAEMMLNAFGVHTCGDVASNLGILSVALTPSLLNQVMRASLGLGQSNHTPPISENDPGRKGMSIERTFASPLTTEEELTGAIESLVLSLTADMEAEKIEGRHITLKIKTSSFELKTRSTTLQQRFASTSSSILPHVIKLMLAELPVSARLIGVRISTLRKKGFVGPLDQWLGHGGTGKDVLQATEEIRERAEEEDGPEDCADKVKPLLGLDPPDAGPSTSISRPCSSAATTWTCKACTFAGNTPLILRCVVCDSLKGLEHLQSVIAKGEGSQALGGKLKRPRPRPQSESSTSQTSIKDMFLKQVAR